MSAREGRSEGGEGGEGERDGETMKTMKKGSNTTSSRMSKQGGSGTRRSAKFRVRDYFGMPRPLMLGSQKGSPVEG